MVPTPSSTTSPGQIPAFDPLQATFTDAALEREFRTEHVESTRAFVRFSVALASAAFLSYGLHDWFVLGELAGTAWAIRYGVFVPVAAAVYAALGIRSLDAMREPLLVTFGAAASAVVLWIAALAPESAYLLYTSYAPLFVVMGPFLLRMSVVSEAALTAITVVLFLILDALVAHASPTLRLSIAVTLVTMGAIGTLVARQQSRQARESFLQRRTIEQHAADLTVEKQRSEELLLNVLPKPIADRLKADSSAIADGFAEVSVLFADIVGFTRMSERVPPAEIVGRLNEVFSSFDDLADKLRLEKIKTIGDAYMVAGGLNFERHDHAEALAEMAMAMQRRMEGFSTSFGEALSLRIGIHTGPAVAGVIGKKKFIYDVWGDTVNTASRMESHGEPGTIHVTETVYTRLEPKYEFRARGEIEVKGKGKMKTWFLLGRRSGAVAKTHLPWEETT